MSRHTSYRGKTIDMDSMRVQNEKSVAIGNMGVNANGDRVKNGVITKTVDQIAREQRRVPVAITRTSLKDPIDDSILDVPAVVKETLKTTKSKTQKELPNGDIVEE